MSSNFSVENIECWSWMNTWLYFYVLYMLLLYTTKGYKQEPMECVCIYVHINIYILDALEKWSNIDIP